MKRTGESERRGWTCDNTRPGTCRSGITAFHQSHTVPGWHCRAHDFDQCLSCLQFFEMNF
jgi:hypothetical protein